MSRDEGLFATSDVSITNNDLASRISLKRDRVFYTDENDSQTEKRLKKDCITDEEIEFRDKLLDELSSNLSSQDSDSTVNQLEDGGTNERSQQLRKIIRVEGPLPNLALPEGWIALNHRSGGIIYLHRTTRVCTWARPYYIGKGSVRKHDVPIAAIPCLHQTKALETHKHSRSSSVKTVCPSSQAASVLNFLNIAGSDDNPLDCQRTNGEENRTQPQDAEAIVDDGVNGMATDSDCGIAEECNSYYEVTSQRKSDCGSNIEQDSNTTGTSIVSGDKDFNITINNMEVLDRNNGSDDNYGFKTANDVTGRQIKCNDKDGSVNPVDGLDVVIDTLSAVLDMEQCDNIHPKASGASPISSSKLDMSQTQNKSLKSLSNQELYNSNFTEEQSSYRINPLSLKGNVRNNFINSESENDIPTMKETHFSCSSNPQSGETEDSNSAETETTSVDKHFNNNVKDTDNLLKSTHHTSGIELIEAEDLSSYLNKLFEFEELTIQQEKNVVKPSEQVVEEGEGMLSSALECLPYCVKGKNAKENKSWVLNPGGKTPVAILHEYCQAVLKEKPVYVNSECSNNTTPFMAEVQINGITHGTGAASSKKQAKQIAAEVALEVLMPGVFNKIRDHVISRDKLECFDKLKIDHPNIYHLSNKSGLPTPSQVLQECLKRNQGVCSSTIHFKIVPGESQNHSFKISCGKHTAEGPCKNKKIGKQLASQALLMKLHPHISNWGSLLRIYCDRPSSIVKKYKTPDEESLSNCTSTSDTPRGQVLLARLKQEMLKIADNGYQGARYAAGPADTTTISTVEI